MPEMDLGWLTNIPEPKWPEVSAYREDSEPHRLVRLHRLSGLLALALPAAMPKIKDLHDHKGELTVTWVRLPTDQEQSVIDHIWSQYFNEIDVEHVLPGMSWL
ncbi:MAG TPA: hypothetical protein VNS22_18780 [Geminicoccus sp.]|uniref:hypothetical protein n=1 Tax=Geminicoccus sp. TaxID=2024832 RepID=UPI002B7327E3|nr:hypothetical protein [Geminicoccus sp.]HWL70405.1 hypothetical protein [Geminicoccus sp.]